MLAEVLTLGAGAGNGEADATMRQVVVIMLAAGVVAVLMQRLRLPTIPAYLLTGAVLGPYALGLIAEPAQAGAISKLAIIFLMFGIGLHMDTSVLLRGLRQMVVLTLAAFVGSALLLWPLASLLGLDAPAALTVAMAMSMSSTAVVLRILQDRRELGHMRGRLCLGILIVQDLIAIAILLVLPPLARWHAAVGGAAPDLVEGSVLLSLFRGAAVAAAVLAGVILLGRYVMPRVLHEAAKLRSGEVLTVLSIAAAMGAAALTSLAGLGDAMGAFLAGFMLASTPFRHHLGGQVGVVRDLFGAIFFTAIGMTVSPEVLWENLPQIVIATVVLLAVKTVCIGLAAWATGSTGNLSADVGLSLAQAGEFGIVVLAAATEIGLLSDRTMGLMLSIIVFTLIATPWLISGGAVLAVRVPRVRPPSWARVLAPPPVAPAPVAEAGQEGPGPTRHAIVAGFGLVGRAVADELKKMGVKTTIVELNPSTVKTQSGLGRSIVYGDVANPEVLESAGIHEADVLVLTVPDEESVLRACKAARQMKPDIAIVARTSFVSKGILAAGMGATGVVVEEMATAKEMERVVAQVLKSR